uniref:LIM zinc-binding domain-containing protein n=1 Tax=Plectus sambesii TaxID=2011161 RepID=A0A914V2Q3_9BILA
MSESFEKLEELSKWTEANGHFFRSRHPWLAGDWRTLLEALNLLLNAERRLPSPPVSPGSTGSDTKILYKLSFDSTTQLAEEALGIPLLIVESDLDVKQPTSRMAVLTYTICMKHSYGSSLSGFNRSPSNTLEDESRVAIDIKPPEEAPTCRQCKERPFFAERVVVDKAVWHRRCFRCSKCSKQLHRGAFRQSLNQTHAYECLEHDGRSLLDDNDSKVVKEIVDKPTTNSKPALPPKPSLTKPTIDIADECDHYSSADPPIANANSPVVSPRAGGSLKSSGSQNPFDDDDEGDDDQLAKSPAINLPATQTTAVPPTIQLETANAAPESLAPVAPPRRKRQSQQNSQQSSRSGSLNRILDDLPKKAAEAKPDICDYPDFLNPFGSDDGNDSDTTSDYDDTLNPFADDQDDDSSATGALSDADSLSKSMSAVRLRTMPPPVPAKPRLSLQPGMLSDATDENRRRSMTPSKSPSRMKRQAPQPPSQLPGDSDRPKSNPPPPPKPPRPSIETLQRRKKRQAPPPPMPLKRKVKFTDHKIPESLDEVTSTLTALDAEQEKLEVLGKAAEKELLFVIEQSPKDWERHAKVEQWIQLVEQKCELIKRESAVVCNWLEMYLNELHSDTEYQLRCLIEKPESEKSDADIAREAKLLESLLDIISQKNRLIESQDTTNTRRMSADEDTLTKPAISPDKAKSKKLKIRIKKLRKKLGEGKKTKKENKE